MVKTPPSPYTTRHIVNNMTSKGKLPSYPIQNEPESWSSGAFEQDLTVLSLIKSYSRKFPWPKNAHVRLIHKKVPISLRVDTETLGYFKEQGPGYLTRMNAVLRAYMEAHR